MSDNHTELEATARLIGERISTIIGRRHGLRIGFALFLFEHGEDGMTAYVGSVEREGMREVLEEVVARLLGELEGTDRGSSEKGHGDG
jgi:hypothetical protein